MSLLSGSGRVWPDLHLDVPCCMGCAAVGPQACTCWQPIHDLEQATDLDMTADPGTQPALCSDCAAGRPFYCHQGMRRVLAWHHPSGTVLTGEVSEYDPPIRAQAGGQPALLCGGWAAVRRRHEADR